MIPRTLGPYAERFLTLARARTKPRTREAYEGALKNHIVPALGAETPLVNVTRAVLRDFIADRLAAGYGPRTVHGHFKVVRALLSAATDDEVLEANPALRLGRAFPRWAPPAARGKAIPRAELERLLAAARERHGGLGAFLLVLARTGCRVGEALALKWENVDLDQRVLHVRHSLDHRRRLGTPKSGRARTVDLSRDATVCLAALREAADPAVPWVFPSPRRQPWSRTRLRTLLIAALERAGLPSHYRMHALRHSFASLLADAGTSPWVIRDLLGHRDVATTQVYVQLRERHLEAVEGLDTPP